MRCNLFESTLSICRGRHHQHEADNPLPEEVLQLPVGDALCVHEPHLLATLVADPEPFLRAAAAHVHDVLVHFHHVLGLGLEELGVLEQRFHGDGPVPVNEMVMAQRYGAAEVFADANALAGTRPSDPVAVALVQQAIREALLAEGLHVCGSLERHAHALGRRVQSADRLLARRPRLLVLAQALGLVLGLLLRRYRHVFNAVAQPVLSNARKLLPRKNTRLWIYGG